MTLEEYFGLIALGLPAGFLLLGLFSGQEKAKARQSLTNWCLAFGGLSVLLGGIAAISHAKLVATRGILGALFIGLPAFPAGLMLLLLGGSTKTDTEGENDGEA
ncbi:hypothetical protein [Aromatoleum petrolei]|uniref:Transmembrane protein n=1 Tax=Aromatoleum petrolei TaxID=76116 RepID=A0ABX1MJX2_9RHOO|nr:hypothetical protein [Aromatoleum petrolei]NMF88267.1 hypothetical protein [Aromatoleum petrolei]